MEKNNLRTMTTNPLGKGEGGGVDRGQRFNGFCCMASLSLMREINHLRANFKRHKNMEKIHCVKNCQAEMDINYLVILSNIEWESQN